MPKILLSMEQAHRAIQEHIDDFGYPNPYIESAEDLAYWTERYIRESILSEKDNTISVSPKDNGVVVSASPEILDEESVIISFEDDEINLSGSVIFRVRLATKNQSDRCFGWGKVHKIL